MLKYATSTSLSAPCVSDHQVEGRMSVSEVSIVLRAPAGLRLGLREASGASGDRRRLTVRHERHDLGAADAPVRAPRDRDALDALALPELRRLEEPVVRRGVVDRHSLPGAAVPADRERDADRAPGDGRAEAVERGEGVAAGAERAAFPAPSP